MYRRVTPEKSGERKTSHLPGDYCQLSVQLAVLQLSNHLLTSKIGIDDRVLVIIDRRLTGTRPVPRQPPNRYNDASKDIYVYVQVLSGTDGN